MNVLDTAASPVIIDSTLKIQGIWLSSPCRWVLLFSFHVGAPKRVGHVTSCNRRKDVAERSIFNIAPCLWRGWVSAVVWWFLYVFVCYIMRCLCIVFISACFCLCKFTKASCFQIWHTSCSWIVATVVDLWKVPAEPKCFLPSEIAWGWAAKMRSENTSKKRRKY